MKEQLQQPTCEGTRPVVVRVPLTDNRVAQPKPVGQRRQAPLRIGGQQHTKAEFIVSPASHAVQSLEVASVLVPCESAGCCTKRTDASLMWTTTGTAAKNFGCRSRKAIPSSGSQVKVAIWGGKPAGAGNLQAAKQEAGGTRHSQDE